MIVLTLLLALVLDALFGDPPNRFHPVVAMGSFIRWASQRTPASGNARQFIYGMIFMLIGIALFSLPLIALQSLLQPYPWLAVIVNALLLKVTFSMRRLLEAGREVETALAQGNLPEARRAVSWHLVSRNTNALGEGHVSSATTESLAENLPDSFIAPLLAFAIGGLPLAWAYRFINTADAMIGYHDEKHEYLGKFAARLDDLLNWIPSRLGGLFIALAAAPFASGSLGHAWRTMLAQHNRTASPNAGWPMSAAAGALGVTLEKINYYMLEGGPHLPDVAAIRRARRLILAASLLSSLFIAAICWGVDLAY
jgi:adenosylcobinamide-phosphate synthase